MNAENPSSSEHDQEFSGAKAHLKPTKLWWILLIVGALIVQLILCILVGGYVVPATTHFVHRQAQSRALIKNNANRAGLSAARNDLQALVTNAEAVDTSEYTVGSGEFFRRAIGDANTCLADPSSTQDEMDDCAENLQEEWALLEPLDSTEELPEDSSSSDSNGAAVSSSLTFTGQNEGIVISGSRRLKDSEGKPVIRIYCTLTKYSNGLGNYATTIYQEIVAGVYQGKGSHRESLLCSPAPVEPGLEDQDPLLGMLGGGESASGFLDYRLVDKNAPVEIDFRDLASDATTYTLTLQP